jgi:hypothetical protein
LESRKRRIEKRKIKKRRFIDFLVPGGLAIVAAAKAISIAEAETRRRAICTPRILEANAGTAESAAWSAAEGNLQKIIFLKLNRQF